MSNAEAAKIIARNYPEGYTGRTILQGLARAIEERPALFEAIVEHFFQIVDLLDDDEEEAA